MSAQMMELGDMFDDELATTGVWLPLGPAPEWIIAGGLLEKRAVELGSAPEAGVLRDEVKNIRERLATSAMARVRFLRGDVYEKIVAGATAPADRRVRLALSAVTRWRGVTAGGRLLEFNTANLERVALSSDSFLDFVGRTCRNLPLLTAWRDMEVKKN